MRVTVDSDEYLPSSLDTGKCMRDFVLKFFPYAARICISPYLYQPVFVSACVCISLCLYQPVFVSACVPPAKIHCAVSMRKLSVARAR